MLFPPNFLFFNARKSIAGPMSYDMSIGSAILNYLLLLGVFCFEEGEGPIIEIEAFHDSYAHHLVQHNVRIALAP